MEHPRRTPLALLFVAAAAALAALVLLTACADEESAAGTYRDPLPPRLVGVQLHPLWAGVSNRTAARELNLAKRHGATVVRVDMGWASLEHRGKGRISRPYARRLDAILNYARRRRVKVIGTLLETPCWASSAPSRVRQRCRGEWWRRGVTDYPPRRAKDFADIARYVARRWGNRMAALEIWNEPNIPDFMNSPDPVKSYARLVRASYRPIKRAAPRLPVLAGATLRADGEFLDDLYARGRIRGYYDAISYHPYSAAPAQETSDQGAERSFVAGTRWFRRIMDAHGDEDAELWATEVGASSCPKQLNDVCVSRAEQADRIDQYLRTARQFPYLRAIVVYNLRDKGDPRFDVENGFGLVNSRLRAKPSLHAFRRAAKDTR
jgi:hypothetical protein